MTSSLTAAKARKKGNDGPRSQRRAAIETRIIDAAEHVFAEVGLRGATVERIAEAASLSKPNLHYYFPTKDDLYIAVLRRTLDLWLPAFTMLDQHGDPQTELGRYIVEKVDMARRYPKASRVFANEMLRGAPYIQRYLHEDLRRLVAQKSSIIRHWIDRGQLRDVDPFHLIFLIWSATQHYADFRPQVEAVMGRDGLDEADFDAVAQSLCDILFHGILPRPEPS